MKSLRAAAFIALAGAGCWESGQREAEGAPAPEKTEQALTALTAAATVLATSPGATRFAAQSEPVPVDSALTLTGDDPIDGAQVAIGAGFAANQDALGFTPSGGVTGSYSATSGVLTLAGTASPATYAAVLRSVTYTNGAGASPAVGARSIRFSLVSNLYSPATGHYYEYVVAHGTDWGTAMAAASARSYFGLRGYLATVTSAEENDFIRGFLSEEAWLGAMATQTPSSPSNLAGDYGVPRTWYWVTGPEAGTPFFSQVARCPGSGGAAVAGRYANWRSGEPNDFSLNPGCAAPGTEAFGEFFTDGTWNDYPYDNLTVHGYVVEYGGMPDDPTPVLSAVKELDVVGRASAALISSVNPSVSGQPVSFTVELTPSSATGTVQFRVDGADLGGPAAVASSAATSPVAASLAVGDHSVEAVYSGDGAVSGATATVSQTVEKDSTVMALTPSVNPASYGQAAVLTAAASAAAPGGGTPTGRVELFDGKTSLGSAALVGGQAALTVSSLEVGSHALTAVYSGDVAFEGSTSDALDFRIGRAATAVQLSTSASPSVWGQAVQLTASVAPTGATGAVDFFDGAALLGTAAVASGAASFTTAALAAGDHVISASYRGDPHFAPSASAPLTQAVSKAPAGATLAASPSPSVYGQTVVLTAAVGSSETGAVTFFDGSAALGTSALANGSASLAVSTLEVGVHALSATYEGDANHESGSAAASAEVDKAASATSLASSRNPCLAGESVALTAAVSAVKPGVADPTGAVEFFDGAISLGTAALTAGKAQFTTGALAAGSHAFTAQYAGDAHLRSSASGPLAQAVNPSCQVLAAIVADGAANPANDCQVCLAATSPSAWSSRPLGYPCADDGSANTDDYCDGAGACVHPAKNHCSIGGASYASGAANPDNPCQVCDPAAGAFQWTVRPAGYACTSDGLDCTRDACDGAGTCSHELTGGCLIGGQCVASAALDPSDDCRACNPAIVSSRYSPRAKGEGCADDGNPATLDVCDGLGACTHGPQGQCTIGGQAVAAGAANPDDACQACDPASSTSGWSNRVQGFPCADDGLACTRDACDGAGACQHALFAGCLIAGACESAGDLDPSNDCRACDPAVSTGAYSPRAKGEACADDGDPATLDVCDGASACTHSPKGACTIGGVVVQAGSANPDNACQACDPASSAAAWTSRVSGYPCAADGLACTLDACDGSGACQHSVFEGCLIDGACLGKGATDPASECSECNPSLQATGFSPKPKGAACADDGAANTLDVCDGAGACTHPYASPCTIGGVVYGGGAANPENPCAVCDASVSAQAWSPRASGIACASDGLACTSDACDGSGQCRHTVAEGCLIGGACVAQGAADPTSDCRVCDAAQSTAAYTLLSSADCLGACASDADCTGGAFCLQGVCRPPRPEDSSCTVSSQCASGLCKAGVCAGVAMVGGCGCSAGAGAELPAALAAAALLGAVARRRCARRRL